MSTANRRNGKAASCEPCRKSKLRCDHSRPLCGRCVKRGIADDCFYHPAPLTRPREGAVRKLTQSNTITSPQGPNHSHIASKGDHDQLRKVPNEDGLHTNPESPVVTVLMPLNMDMASSHQIGHLGPMSYATDLNAYLSSETEQISGTNTDTSPQSQRTDSLAWRPDQVQTTIEILNAMIDFPTIADLIEWYYKSSSAAAIPAMLVLNMLKPLNTFHQEHFGHGQQSVASSVAEAVLNNESRVLQITPNMSTQQFNDLITGPNLRLEAVALVYALAARAWLFGYAPRSDIHDKGRAFADRLDRATTQAIDLAFSLGVSNDLFVWLLYEGLLLTTNILGDGSVFVWRRLGHLATEIFNRGFHRESPLLEQMPFWSIECWRRVYAAAYQLDKSLVTFLGRPPRISRRHSDVQMPLDLSYEDLMLEGEELEAARRRLSPDGWCRDNVYRSASWIRHRFIMAQYREEVCDFFLEKPENQTEERVRDILQRCEDAWKSMPKRLHYTEDCWNAGLSSGTYTMLVITRLSYLHSRFQIYRFLAKTLCRVEAYGSLIDVAFEQISISIAMGNRSAQSFEMRRDNSWVIILYGVPSAVVLAEALLLSVRQGSILPGTVSRSQMIRNLSVFISGLSHTAGPGTANHNVSVRAQRILSQLLDEALNTETAGPGTEQATGDSQQPFSIDPDDMIDFSSFGNFDNLFVSGGAIDDSEWTNLRVGWAV